jgi:hypothetical protein
VGVRLFVAIVDLASQLEREEFLSSRTGREHARACCFDQKEESSLIVRDHSSFLLFQSQEAVYAC